MTLTQYSYIVAVADHGTFLRAAKACHVSQPTLSMQIQKLEELLGAQIFDRTKQPALPTIVGEKVLAQARVVLREAARLLEIVAEATGEVSGEFRLGIIPTLAPYLLPLFVQSFIKKYPKVALVIEELKTEEITSALQRDLLDAAILVTPLGNAQLTEQKLFDEPFLLYVNKNDPMAKAGKIRDRDLPSERVLLLNEGHCMRQQVINICRLRQEEPKKIPNVRFESGSLSTLLRMVEKGLGYTIIPFLAVAEARRSQAALVDFVGPTPVREVSLVYHRTFVKRSIVASLVDEVIGNLPAELLDQTAKVKRIDI